MGSVSRTSRRAEVPGQHIIWHKDRKQEFDHFYLKRRARLIHDLTEVTIWIGQARGDPFAHLLYANVGQQGHRYFMVVRHSSVPPDCRVLDHGHPADSMWRTVLHCA